LTRWNGAGNTLTGLPAPEADGRSFWDFLHPDDLDAARAALVGLAHGQSAVVEHRLATVSDGWMWARSHGVGGEDGWVLIICRDITGEKLRELEAQEAMRTTAMLREAAGVSIWRYDPDSDRYDLNPDFTHAAPARDDDWKVAGRQVRATVHVRDVPALHAAWEDTLATGAPHTLQYRERRGPRAWRHVRVAFQGVRQRTSGRWEAIGIAQDVTDLVRARDAALRGEQDAKAAAEAKSLFLANISHELRTPMNGVLGMLHLLRQNPALDQRTRLIDEALASGAGLSDLLNDIIDY